MNADGGRGYHWISSSPNDVKLSVIDFYRMTDVIRDMRLSPEGLIRYKNMYECSLMSLQACVLFCPVPALAFAYIFSTRVRKSHSGYR